MGTTMDHDMLFKPRLDGLRDEGRYRIFAELERCAGRFPRAFDHRIRDEITIWCSNDYLGMGQHPDVLAAMHAAIDRSGARSEEHTSELQSRLHLVCRLLLE